MSYQDLFDLITQRLGESTRPDGGWFIVTRVHLNIERLSKIVGYMYMAGIGERRTISATDYRSLAKAVLIGSSSSDPGSIIRRHYFLAMETPLRLLERDSGKRWESVRLSTLGKELAVEANKHAVLERILNKIVFCREPWYTRDRVEKYPDFEIRPYPTLIQILKECDGYLDKDEFGLFVYTLKSETETSWTIAMIREFRQLDSVSRERFLTNIRQVFFDQLDLVQGTDTGKAYQNWRDMALHSFAFFSLGTSVLQEGTRLILTGGYGGGAASPMPAVGTKKTLVLKPIQDGSHSLTVPPPVQANSGSEAEQFIAKLLRSQGWEVVFYTDKRGFGFDLWAKLGDVSIVIEVKSSLSNFGVLQLTELEEKAARNYGQSYILAIVENMSVLPKVYYIANPAETLKLTATTVSSYQSTRSNWITAAAETLSV